MKLRDRLKRIAAPENLVWVIAIGVVVIIILVFIFRPVPTPSTSPLEDYLKKQNDSLIRANEGERMSRINSERMVDSLTRVVENIDQKIITIQKTYEKRILVYDTFTVEQLERYFTDRAKRNHSKVGSDINR